MMGLRKLMNATHPNENYFLSKRRAIAPTIQRFDQSYWQWSTSEISLFYVANRGGLS